MNENLKTRKEHLKVLPLQKRLQAMENIRKEAFPSFQKSLEFEDVKQNLLGGLFTFKFTRQGHNYWSIIDFKYYGGYGK